MVRTVAAFWLAILCGLLVSFSANAANDNDAAALKRATADCQAQVKEYAKYNETSWYGRRKMIKQCVKGDALARRLIEPASIVIRGNEKPRPRGAGAKVGLPERSVGVSRAHDGAPSHLAIPAEPCSALGPGHDARAQRAGSIHRVSSGRRRFAAVIGF